MRAVVPATSPSTDSSHRNVLEALPLAQQPNVPACALRHALPLSIVVDQARDCAAIDRMSLLSIKLVFAPLLSECPQRRLIASTIPPPRTAPSLGRAGAATRLRDLLAADIGRARRGGDQMPHFRRSQGSTLTLGGRAVLHSVHPSWLVMATDDLDRIRARCSRQSSPSAPMRCISSEVWTPLSS